MMDTERRGGYGAVTPDRGTRAEGKRENAAQGRDPADFPAEERAESLQTLQHAPQR